MIDTLTISSELTKAGIPSAYADAISRIAVVALSLSMLSAAGCSQNEPTLENLLARADAGDAEAQSTLGRMYADGDGAPQDYTEAVTWLRRAAAQNKRRRSARSRVDVRQWRRRRGGRS